MNELFKCDVCDFYSRFKRGLNRHINQKHLKKYTINRPTCPYCNLSIGKNFFKSHLKDKHNCTELDIFKQNIFINTPGIIVHSDVLDDYLNKIFEYNGGKNIFLCYYNGYCELIKLLRSLDVTDNDYFLSTYLPYKMQHKKVCNSKELCQIVCHNNKEESDRLYDKIVRTRNGYHNHQGKCSIFSKKYKYYSDLTEQEKQDKISKIVSKIHNRLDVLDLYPTRVQYWLNKGFSEIEAKEKIKARCIFSLEKCIARYGEKEGINVYKDRQIRWQNTLKSKPNEEILRINKSKGINREDYIKKYGVIAYEIYNFRRSKCLEAFIYKYGHKIGLYKWNKYLSNCAILKASNESLKYFIPLYKYVRKTLHVPISDIYLGISGSREFYLRDNKNIRFYDFTIKSKKLIIEFNGEAWHPNPKWLTEDLNKWNNWKKAITKETAPIVNTYYEDKLNIARKHKYDVLVIWSSDTYDYNWNKIMEFINEKCK